MKRADTKPYILTIFILLTAQFILWNGLDYAKEGIWTGTRNIKNEMEIIPPVPSREILKAFSFGDEQMAFRYYGYKLQFAGDLFGRVTPLKDYDYAKLYKWWKVLDEIDPISDLVVNMVTYYFGATQNPKEQLPYVVKFIEEHSDKNPELKWWWYAQAVYNARYGAEDDVTALRIANKLAKLPKELRIPIWTRQLEAFIYEKRGEFQPACDIIINVIKEFGQNRLSEGEMNFMYYFITERLSKMAEEEKKKGKIEISDECRYLLEVKKASDLKEEATKLK